MRSATLFLLCALVPLAGCADLYYRAIGEGDWPHARENLYSRLGGKEGIARVVDDVTGTATRDPRISRYFAGADLPRFKEYFAEQLCARTGGPCYYTGPGMTDAHASLAIDQAAFDAFLDDLRKSLAANGVSGEDQLQLMRILAPYRDKVVTIES